MWGGITLALLYGIISKPLNITPVILFIAVFFICSEILILRMLVIDSRYIKANDEYITYINPILPFLKKRVYWSEYDYYYHVKEHASNATYRTIWLVKNGRLQDRISDFNYKNFSQIRHMATKRVESHGIFRTGNFSLLLYTFGYKLPKNYN